MAEPRDDAARESNAYWDAIASAPTAKGHDLWRRHADAVNALWLIPWLPDRVERILKTDLYDEAVGAGLGALLASRCGQLAGIDISARMTAAAQRRFPALDARVADVRHLPFADGGFDVVVSNSTLDHFLARADILIALKELARVLRPGGELLLTLDNRANPVIGLRGMLPSRLLLRLGLTPYYVGATCGPRGLGRLAREAGLETREMTAIMHCPRAVAVAVCRLLDRRGARAQRVWLGLLASCERLRRLPTRYLTGYFVAMRAAKPEKKGI